MLQGLFLVFSASVILFNLIADLLYAYLDPRVRTVVSAVAAPVGPPDHLAAAAARRWRAPGASTAATARDDRAHASSWPSC